MPDKPKTADLEGVHRVADEGGPAETYLREAADEIERLRAERDKFETAWNEVSDRYETLLNQLGATDDLPTRTNRLDHARPLRVMPLGGAR